jgi:hypothetical protein
MLQTLNINSILEFLDEISDNGDSYGYVRDNEYYVGEEGYYQEYKDQFDDLSDGAYYLADAMRSYDIRQNWDDMTVALLGVTHKIIGYESTGYDYNEMLSYEEELAESEAVKRIERINKKDMIRCFRKVLTTLVSFYDIKAAHDCLTSIVTELDERAAMMQRDGNPPQRSWVE